MGTITKLALTLSAIFWYIFIILFLLLMCGNPTAINGIIAILMTNVPLTIFGLFSWWMDAEEKIQKPRP